ncbi:MAG: hypothetical protein IID33_02130 [Planctomycetes bacterium]|nr:hypothetical protein [Planctomycetota bacterium]
MTVSGILSGLTNPLGRGFALSRAAVRADATSPPRHGENERIEESQALRETESRFDTQDVVELSEEASNGELNDEEQQQVTELKQRDSEVRAHEQAHLAAAGANAKGGASFEYQTGPDGRRYAVGGEVQIDTSPIDGDPQATIQKMQQVRAAALAPGSPSSQDRAVAAQAAAAIQEASAEQAQQKSEPEETSEADPSKITGNHAFGANASAAAEHGIQTALEQFGKPKGKDNAPGQLKKAEPIIAFSTVADRSEQRPRSDAAAGELLDLVA